MNKDKQRIAIAEACGHKNIRMAHFCNDCGAGEDYMSDHSTEWPIPDYLTDLNAMHEAEKTLTEELQSMYGYTLGKMTDSRDTRARTVGQRMWQCVHITAEQRAEAFLRTIGKWEDSA